MSVMCERGRWTMRMAIVAFVGSASLLIAGELVFAEAGLSSSVRQHEAARQDSVPISSPGEVPKGTPALALAAAPSEDQVQSAAPSALAAPAGAHSYDPSGRRDPFAPVLQQLAIGPSDPLLPPLQRVGLTELNLIAVVWGAYGYAAMVQTPDGSGYTVRRGTRIGSNNGVVSDVTEKGIVVQERFTDVYGSKQEREYVKLLHPKEGAE